MFISRWALFPSVAEANYIAVWVCHGKVARPRHIFQFLSDVAASGTAAPAEFVHVVIDVTINADAKRAVAGVLRQQELQPATLNPDDERQASREPVLR
jgi:hypothetical protein